MNYCLIVIPLYKKELSYFENISLSRVLEVCNDNPIVLIAPYEIELKNYLKILKESECNFTIKYFNKQHCNHTGQQTQNCVIDQFQW